MAHAAFAAPPMRANSAGDQRTSGRVDNLLAPIVVGSLTAIANRSVLRLSVRVRGSVILKGLVRYGNSLLTIA